jgi:protein-S-isoprenylcysteine O-methyltransferase Ste14
MTRSASTPRLRATHVYFLFLVLLTAIAGPAPSPAVAARVGMRLADGAASLLVAAACLGRIWCSVFIAGRKDAQLVTEGPYARVRHPLYTLSFLGGLGLGIATGSLALVALTALVLSVLLSRAARREDHELAARFSADFPPYAARTPRFWPRRMASGWPDSYVVQPRVLWKAFVDAGAFFALLVLVSLARALRDGGVTPTWLPLP